LVADESRPVEHRAHRARLDELGRDSRREGGRAVLGFLGSCTTALYPGHSLPSSEVATLASSDTRIDSIDGKSLGAGSAARYEILPGLHKVGVSLHQFNPGVMFRRGKTSGTLEVYFKAKPGHSYFTAPLVDGSRREPHVVDEKSGTSVSSFEPPNDDDD
jgi:hypothetical protein